MSRGRLPTVRPRIAQAPRRAAPALTTAERRMTGRALQARRLSVWSRDPHCASCGRVTAYPGGFELDHIVALHKGGADTDANCQILCVHAHLDGGRVVKTGCHVEKSAREARGEE